MKARDLATLGVAQVPFDAKVRDVVREMVKTGVHGVAVVSEDGTFMGVVEQEHILEAMDPENPEKVLDLPVEEIMDEEPAIVDPEDDLRTVLKLMRDENVTRVFIVSCEGRPVGVVSLTDVLRVVSEEG